MPKLLLIAISAALCLVSLGQAAHAQTDTTTIKLNVPLGQLTEVTSFAQYFQTWYSLLVGGAAVLAVVMIMWAGTKWLASRGNSSEINEAKQIIWSSVIGLSIALLSYTILFFINPNLVRIGLPQLPRSTGVNLPVIADFDFHDGCGDEVIRLDDGTTKVLNPCPPTRQSGTFSNDQGANASQLAASGWSTAHGADITHFSDETVTGLSMVAMDIRAANPNAELVITSGYRTNSTNHIRGDTADIRTNADTDAFFEGLSQYQTGSSQTQEGYPIYTYGPNDYGITRIIDERTKPGQPHWHVEF